MKPELLHLGYRMAKTRKSNFELLRIVSMLMIIVHHISLGCPWPQGEVGKCVVLLVMQFGGKLGVDLFMLITGYMSIKSRFKVRSLLRVAFQTWFYSVAILLLFLVFARGDVNDVKMFIKSFIPNLSCLYWFVTFYIGVVLISPFLNALVAALGQDGTKKLLAVLLFAFSVIPTFVRLTFILNNLAWFSFLYLLAGYMRLWGTPWGGRKVLLWICTPFLVVTAVGIAASLATGSRSLPLATAESVFMVAAAVGCFKWFSQLDLGSIKIVNTIASGSFAVYLIHSNWLSGQWLIDHLTFVYEMNPALLLFTGIGVAGGVYLVCTAIDLVRQRLLEVPLMRVLEGGRIGHLLDAYDEWINTVSPA